MNSDNISKNLGSSIRDVTSITNPQKDNEGPKILGPDNFTMDDSYSKEDALFDLIDAENTLDDAKDNLDVIQSNIRRDETLEDATEQFIRILHAEGNEQSEEVQAHYVIIGNSLKPGENRKMATDEFLNLIRAESNPKFAFSDFKVIRSYQKSEETITEATREFIRLLTARGNAGTDTAKTCFVTISNSLRPGESRQFATSQMLKLLRAGAPVEENDVKRHYQLIDQALGPDESRSEITNQYIKLLATKTGKSTAAANFRVIRACQRNNESLMSAISQFNRLLEIEGHKNVEKVQMHYQLLNGTLRTNESRVEIMDIIENFINAGCTPDEALDAYRFIDGYVKSPGDRLKMTRQYLDTLTKFEGEDRYSQAREIFRKNLYNNAPGEF